MKSTNHLIASIVATVTVLLHGNAISQQSIATDEAAQRVRRVLFSDNLVIGVTGYPDHPTVLEVGGTEPVEDVAGGQVSNWEVVKKSSRVFFRPLDGARSATIIVTTKSRSYVVDLNPGKGPTPTAFVSRIVVEYPPVISAPDNAKLAKQVRDEASPLTESAMLLRNSNYSLEIVSMTVDIKPREVFDDGRFTYFKFPANLPVPAIYQTTPGTEDEWLVNSHRDEDYVVIQSVGAAWNLRLAGSMLGIFNDSYDAAGLAAVGNTTVGGVKREVR